MSRKTYSNIRQANKFELKKSTKSLLILVSESTFQLTFKKLPLAILWCGSKGNCLFNFIYLCVFGCTVFFIFFFFLAAHEISLVLVSRSYSLVAMRRPLIVVSSLLARASALDSAFSSTRAQLLHGMWNLSRAGMDPISPAWASGFLITAPPGKSKGNC